MFPAYILLPVLWIINGPFQEIFIIPYLLWFVYIAATVIYFLLHEDENFNALAGTLALGMTLFLVVSAIYPNGLNLQSGDV